MQIKGKNVWLSRRCKGYGGNPNSTDPHYLVRLVPLLALQAGGILS